MKKHITKSKKKFSPENQKPAQNLKKTKSRIPKGQNPDNTDKETFIRLNRYLSMAGICSRREADKYIQAGLVKVNGKTVTELGTKVKKEDIVTFSGQRVVPEKKVYILLNKPKGYITTRKDDRQRKTVMELISGMTRERVYPVGRLDRNTTGLLLLTNDGELAKKLMHPSSRIEKVYHVELNRNLTAADMALIREEGVNLDDGKFKPDEIAYDGPNKSHVGIRIHSGRNRIVRRMFEALGYEVIKLDRVVFAGLTKKNLPRGKARFLTDKEVAFLKML